MKQHKKLLIDLVFAAVILAAAAALWLAELEQIPLKG